MGECSLNTSLQGVAMKVVLPLLVCAIALAAVASAKPQLGEYLERAKKPGGKPGGKPGKPGNAGGKPGKPGKPGMEEKGLCLSTDEVSILCMSNTEFGTKFGGVYHSCMEDNEEEEGEEERAKKPGKPGKPSKPGKPNKPGKPGNTSGKPRKPGKPSVCVNVTIEDVTERMREKFEDELCVAQGMGWYDDQLNFDSSMYSTDISSLPIASDLDAEGERMTGCLDDLMEKATEMGLDECWDDVSDTDKLILEPMFRSAASAYCFREVMGDSCSSLIESMVGREQEGEEGEEEE